MAKWPASSSYPGTTKAYPVTPKAYPATVSAFPTAGAPAVPTFEEIALANGNTNIREFWARPADVTYTAVTGLVSQVNETIGGVLHLTNGAADATRPEFAAADGSTVATTGTLPGLSELIFTRANNTVVSNASLNRAQEHMVCALVRFTSLNSLSRFFASVGANGRAIFYTPSGVCSLLGSALGPQLSQIVINEWYLVICHFKGAAGAELVAKHFYATANDGAGVSTGFQVGRDVTAGNSGAFRMAWMGICDGAFGSAQRNQLRTWVNSLATWRPIDAPPPGGESVRIDADGDSNMAGNGGGGGMPSPLTLVDLGSANPLRIVNKAVGGSRMTGVGGIDARYATANGIGPLFFTPTNADFTVKQVALLGGGTNDAANSVTAVDYLTALDSILAKCDATGFDVKVVYTIPRSGVIAGADETERLAMNAGIRARVGTTIDAVVELADPDPLIGTYSDGANWFDQTHYMGPNLQIVADLTSAAVLSVI